MTDLPQHPQQPEKPLQAQEPRPPQEQQPPQSPQQDYRAPEEAQPGQLGEEAKPYRPQAERQAPATEVQRERREEAAQPPPPPAESIRQLLDKYMAELQGVPAETEATKQFAKDLDDLAKEYDGVSAIVAKYRTAHQKFVEQMKPVARIQRDEVESWSDDPDEIPDDLRATLDELSTSYAQRAEAITSALEAAKSALNDLKSPLDKAKGAEADAQAAFERAKAFETTANGWFTELTGLHKSARAELDARNYRLVYAYFLEVEDVWGRIRSLDESLEGAPAKTPNWLLQKLNQALRALIEAKRGRYLAHKEWLEKDKAVTTARANHKYFIDDGGRRKDFLREAQDVEPGQRGSSPPGSEAAPQNRQQAASGPGRSPSETTPGRRAVASAG